MVRGGAAFVFFRPDVRGGGSSAPTLFSAASKRPRLREMALLLLLVPYGPLARGRPGGVSGVS